MMKFFKPLLKYWINQNLLFLLGLNILKKKIVRLLKDLSSLTISILMPALHLLTMKDGLKKIYREPYKLDEPSRDRLLWFDQDILNSYLNGMYTELPIELNFTDIDLPISEVKKEAIFYHFWGKKKPWTVKVFTLPRKLYQIMLKPF